MREEQKGLRVFYGSSESLADSQMQEANPVLVSLLPWRCRQNPSWKAVPVLFVIMCEPKRIQDEAGFVRQAIKKYHLPHQKSRSFMEIIDTRDLQHHTGYIYACRRDVCG